MFHDVGSTINTLLGVFAIAAVAYAGLNRARLTGLREDLSDVRNRVKDLESERADDKAALAEKDAAISVLNQLQTGEAHLVVIENKLDGHNTAALQASHEIRDEQVKANGDLRDIRTLLTEIRDQGRTR